MGKIKEIFQNFRSLTAWRGRSGKVQAQDSSIEARFESLRGQRELSLTLPRGGKPRSEWVLVSREEDLYRAFFDLRDSLFQFNLRQKVRPSEPPPFYTEAGKLAEERPYFYLKPWQDMGLLFEVTAKGWMTSRADKIASQYQFMRERSSWDTVLLYVSSQSPGIYRLESERMGEGRVSLALYKDFLMQTLSKAL